MSLDDYMDIVVRATQEAKAGDMESVATRSQLNIMYTILPSPSQREGDTGASPA